jgi:hypothetical protein
MALSLSKTLRMVCYLLVACGLVYMAMPFVDVAFHRYDSPIAFFAGVFVALFGIPFYFVSRSKVAADPFGRRPVIAVVLWLVAVVFTAVAVRLLYFGIRLYI